MPDFFDARRPHDGLSYDDYLAHWEEQKDRSADDADKEERKMLHYLNYNYERQEHVHAEYEMSDALAEAVDAIDEPQLWMVLTEPWCGDSAFCLPVLAEAADRNDDVTLRILLRDDNLDVMDQYLTGGSRSIPKLVAFGESGQEHFTWGPRPEAGQALFDKHKAAGEDKMQIVQYLMDWYEDGGWMKVDHELAEAIKADAPVTP
jgi:hypothetical protein